MLSSGNWLKNSTLAAIVAAGLFAASTVNAQGVIGGGGIGGGAAGGAAGGGVAGGVAGGAVGGIGGNTAGVYVNPDGVFQYKKSIENKQLMKQREQAEILKEGTTPAF